jgi:Dihaem cytochrome c
MKALLASLMLALTAVPAWADYRSECGSCHVAYPPKLLPAESWRQLMGRLERHFGSDASLDAKTQAEIERFLAANAGRRGPPPGAEPRITQTRWFLKEHRGEIPPGKSPANCIACHAGAEKGNFDDD